MLKRYGFGIWDYSYGISWNLWSLIYNPVSDRYREVLLETYEEKIEEERLKLCRIISCLLFGKKYGRSGIEFF